MAKMSTTPLFIVMAIAIVTGNVITMVIFTTSRRLRMRRYVLIVNLTVADLFVGLISVPMYAYMLIIINYYNIKNNSYDISTAFRSVFRIQDSLFGAASLYGLAALAGERAYATYFPFKHRALSRTKYAIGIAGVWLSALLLTLLLFNFNREVNTIFVALWISVPLVTIITAYILIWIKMTCAKPMVHQAIHKSNKKLTISLAIITMITLVAWIPFMALEVSLLLCFNLKSTCNPIIITSEFIMVSKWFQYGNSVLNVIVYSLRMREFKKELLRRFRCSSSHQGYQANERFELQHLNHNVNRHCPDNDNMNEN